MTPKLVIHGGAGSLEGTLNKAPKIQDALSEIVSESYQFLLKTNARETVIHAVKYLEDNPLFNAGTGSKLQRDGKIRMSAAIMDSNSEKFSGVINIQNVKNPIEIAEYLSDKKNYVLAGDRATHFARKKGYVNYNPTTIDRSQEHEKKLIGDTGTVGAVALDSDGCIAVATSTGGIGGEIPGRVSDTPTVAGNYANKFAGVSSTGIGEQIVNHSLASRIVIRVQDGLDLYTAVEKTMSESRKQQYKFGIIAIDNLGNIQVGKTSDIVYYAWNDGDKFEVFDITLKCDEGNM